MFEDGEWSAHAPVAEPFADPWPQGIPGANPDALARARDLLERSASRREALVWVKGDGIPGTARGLTSGRVVTFDDRGIEARFNRMDRATRACECVNACAGIASPASAIAEARATLSTLHKGEIQANDPRISLALKLLGVKP